MRFSSRLCASIVFTLAAGGRSEAQELQGPLDGTATSSQAGPAADAVQRRPGHFLCKYKPNYFLLSNLTSVVRESGVAREPPGGLVKFQVSVAYPLWVADREKFRCDDKDEDGSWTRFFFGFTQKSVWALWQFSRSSPFLESNYNPELIWYKDVSRTWVGAAGLSRVKLGLEHESNGEYDGPRNRSWNRVYAQMDFSWSLTKDLDSWAVMAWVRGWSPFGIDSHNPDISDRLGYSELIVVVSSGQTGLGRFELENDATIGGIQSGLSWRPGSATKDSRLINMWHFTPYLYVQTFYGYGETLLTYDQKAKSVWAGLRLLE